MAQEFADPFVKGGMSEDVDSASFVVADKGCAEPTWATNGRGVKGDEVVGVY